MIYILEMLFWLAVGLFLYVYLLFPAGVGTIGWTTRRDVARRKITRNESAQSGDAFAPSVSLVIPAHNEELVIAEKIRNALSLDYPETRLQVIVACDGVDDKTAQIAAEFEHKGVVVLDFPHRRGKASLLNDACDRASGDILFLCDANVMFASNSLRLLVSHLADPKVGAASGDVRLDSAKSSFGVGETMYYKMERLIQLGESHIGSMMGVDGGMYVVRRELFRPLRAETVLDDFITSMNVIRSNQVIVFEPEAVASENATEAASTEFRRRIRLGAGASQVLLWRFFPRISQPIMLLVFLSHKAMRWVSPFVLLTGFVALAILAVDRGEFRPVAGLGFLVLSLALIGAISLRFRRLALFGVPFYFVMTQAGMAIGMLRGFAGQANPVWHRTPRTSKLESK